MEGSGARCGDLGDGGIGTDGADWGRQGVMENLGWERGAWRKGARGIMERLGTARYWG